jgi:hypothetical protein
MAFPTVHVPSSTYVCRKAKARTPDSLVELTWRLPLMGFSVFCVVIGVKLNNRIMLKGLNRNGVISVSAHLT